MKTDQEILDALEKTLDHEFERRLFRKYPEALVEACIRSLDKITDKSLEVAETKERLEQLLSNLKKRKSQ